MMADRNFIATVKERVAGEPCFLRLELHEDIGLIGNRVVTLDMPAGTGIKEARALADTLNRSVARIRLS